MISFVNDYNQSACPEILNAIEETIFQVNSGYSSDVHSKHAAELIKAKIKCKEADVQILMGGTQANLIAAAAFLRPHEALIAVETGHVCVHETGAIEATGHKCVTVKGKNGKVTPYDLDLVCGSQHWEHGGILTVKPRMVFISQSTEVGTVYSEAELRRLREKCDEYNLILYCDGARLGSALACSDVTLPILAELCDAFYIGGTKNGALFGEAMVIVNETLQPDFRYIAKQRGGMLEKGWLLGIQFEVMMKDSLYERCGEHATKMAMILKDGLKKSNVEFSFDSPSNQQFCIIDNRILEELKRDFDWEVVNKIDENRTEIRLVTSWNTKESDVRAFLKKFAEIIERKKI